MSTKAKQSQEIEIKIPKIVEGVKLYPIIGKTADEIRKAKSMMVPMRHEDDYPDWIGFGCPCKGGYELGSSTVKLMNMVYCPVRKDRNHGHLMHSGEGFALNPLPIYSREFLRFIIQSLPHLYDSPYRAFGKASFCKKEDVPVLEALLMPQGNKLPVEMTKKEKGFLTLAARNKFYDEHQMMYVLL